MICLNLYYLLYKNLRNALSYLFCKLISLDLFVKFKISISIVVPELWCNPQKYLEKLSPIRLIVFIFKPISNVSVTLYLRPFQLQIF